MLGEGLILFNKVFVAKDTTTDHESQLDSEYRAPVYVILSSRVIENIIWLILMIELHLNISVELLNIF